MKLLPTKRTVKRWAIGLGILLGVLLLVNAVLAWRTESRFQQLVESIRAEGDPASIAELAPPPIPADQNAAAIIDQLSPRLDAFGKDHNGFCNTELGKQLETGNLPNDEQAAAMRAILDQYADLEQQIQDAAAAPQYASTADFTLDFNPFLESQIKRVARLRTISRFVDWRVQTLLVEGEQQAAIDWSLSLLRLSALCKGEPTLVNYLVAVAIRNLALWDLYQALVAGPIDAATHAQIDEALKQLEEDISLDSVFRTERALSISACIEQGWKRAPPVIGKLIGWPVKRYYLPPIKLYDEIIPLADVPYSEVQPQFQTGGKLAVPTGQGVLADLMVPSIEVAMKANSRDIALIRSLRVLNALQQAGDDAMGLADIDLPDEATTDPFTGRPLVVKKSDSGWMVYSVGEDQVDDGGKFDDAKDFGFGPKRSGVE